MAVNSPIAVAVSVAVPVSVINVSNPAFANDCAKAFPLNIIIVVNVVIAVA